MRINPAIQTGITVVSSLFSKYRNLIRLFTRQRKSKKIENSVDQSSPHGKRDYAALLLATRLGIRSGDISSMTLECLDFERNLIRLTQHKTGVFIEFPMVSDVKVAL